MKLWLWLQRFKRLTTKTEIATAVLLEGRTHALDRWVCTALSGPREHRQPLHSMSIPAKCRCPPWGAQGPGGCTSSDGQRLNVEVAKWSLLHWEGWGCSCGSIPTRELWGQLSPRRSNSSQGFSVALVLPCDSEVKARERSRWTLLLVHGSCWFQASQLLELSLCKCPSLWLPRGPQVPGLNSVSLLPMGSAGAIRSMSDPLLVRAGVGSCVTASPALLCAPDPSGTTPHTASDSVRVRKSHLRDSYQLMPLQNLFIFDIFIIP